MGAPTVKICVINCHNHEKSLGQFSFSPGFTISSMAFFNIPDDDIVKYGNRTEWSPIRSVVIRVINKIRRPKRESDLLITSMITDPIGRHDVLLPINHNYYNFRKTKF